VAVQELWVSARPCVTRRRRSASALVALVLALGTQGCRLGVNADTLLRPDGSATLAITLRIDGAMRVELESLGVDPTLDIDAALVGDDTWQRSRTIDADGGLVLRFERDVDDPAALRRAFLDLSDTLSGDDPALVVDLEVVPGRRGAVEVRGLVGVRPPASAGAVRDGVVLGPTREELAARTAEVVEATFDLTLPGEVIAHDADRLDGRRLRWEVPVGSTRAISAVGAPIAWWTLAARGLVSVAIALAVLAALVLVLRRRAMVLDRTRRT